MIVIPLGTNGFFPSFNRHTACHAIPWGKTLIILDAGSGLFRLAEPTGQKLLKNTKEVHLYLSHYHLDHTFGFYAAFELFAGKKVTVFGKETKPVFSELPQLDYFPIDFAKRYSYFRWEKLTEGEHKIDDYTVAVRKQSHRGHGSLAFRFTFKVVPPPRWPEGLLETVGQHEQDSSSIYRAPSQQRGLKSATPLTPGMKKLTLAYITDSEPTDKSVEFVHGVDLLFHEHGFSGKKLLKKRVSRNKHILDGHVTTVGAALVAKEAKVGRLILIHHNPFASKAKLKKHLLLAQSIFPKTILAQDKQEIES